MTQIKGEGTAARAGVMPSANAVPDVSVCLVSYNTRDYLRDCIRSVMDSAAGLTCELIVVDNASADGSAEMVRQEFPQVQLIANPDNRYYSRGNNQAFRASRGRYVLVLNPDTRMQPGCLQNMVEFLDKNPRVGAASCRLVFENGSVSANGWRFRTLRSFVTGVLSSRLSSLRASREELLLDWDRRTSRRVDVVSGAFLMLRREVLDQVGMFDEKFLLYYTDDELCRRIVSAGWEVWYVAEAHVLHAHRASSRKVRVSKLWWIHLRDSMRYYWHYDSPLRAIIMMPLLMWTGLKSFSK